VKILSLKNYYYYFFLIIFLFIGIYLSLNVGITHDEPHSNWVWELNKNKISNIFFKTNYDLDYLDTYHGYYGIGFYLISTPLEIIFSKIITYFNVSMDGGVLLLKHPIVFLFFFISGIFFNKLIFLITKDKIFSNISTIFFLTYPYLIGHSFFNIKDIPFMSIWLMCTFYLIKNLNDFFYKSKIRYKNLVIFALLTAYLLSLRINGILIFFQYLIFLLVYLNIFKEKIFTFVKKIKKEILTFFIILFSFTYILYPNFWDNPFKFVESINFFNQITQTVCTVTLGECMKTQDLPSSYIFIWLFFKLPVLIIFGIILFPFIEKKLFRDKNNCLIVGSLTFTVLFFILLFVLLKINLYDELRQIIFLIPLIFIISFTILFNFKKRLSIFLISFFIIFFLVNNIKMFPYNYQWLNNFNLFVNVNKNFEKDYWGVSTKEIANFFNKNLSSNEACIISNRNEGIKYFLNKNTCFISFSELHKKKQKPYYVVLVERFLNKGLPNNCELIHSQSTRINFSRENIILAKIYKCT